MTFQYDNRHRLLQETRTLDGDPDVTIYDLEYTYDQLGNRETKADSVSELSVEYTYDVELDPGDSSQWPGYPGNVFPTCNNRLLYYELYDQDGERLLRTVSYIYYQGGHVSNINVKDEYHQGVTPGNEADYDWIYNLTLYYDTRSVPRLALWQRWQLDEGGDPINDERLLARDFRYEWLFGGTRARYMTVDFDPSGSEYPENWTPIEPLHLTDYAGVSPYQDATVAEDGQGGWESPATTRNYLFPAADRELPGGAAQYYHGDLLDSTNVTTDTSGDSVSSVAYTAFGELVTGYSELDTRYQYAGGYGYESGLVELAGPNTDLAPLTFQHLGYRWYQPDIGRFVQRDPIGLLGGLNVYAYVLNDPLASIDPLGLDEWVTGGPWYARWFLNLTGARDNWLLDNERRVRIASGIAAGVGVAAGSAALVCVAVGFSPWLGAAALHGAHAGGPHQFPHLQFMLRTGRHITKHIRIPLPKGLWF